MRSGRLPASVKALSAVLAGLVCLGVLAAVLLRHLDRDAAALMEASAACERFISVEAALRQAVLANRVGLTQSYDDTVRLSEASREASAQLVTRVRRAVPGQEARVVQIGAGVREQLDLVEQFKSRNAVLRNALAAFGVLAAEFDEPVEGAGIGPTLRRLGMAILDLTLNTAPDVVDLVDSQIQALTPMVPKDPDRLFPLMRHATVIRDRLPAMDAGLRRLMAVPRDEDVRSLRAAIMARQEVIEADATLYRYAASIVSGLLLLILVRFVLVLRSRARALRRRTGLEQSLAGLAAGLSDPVGIGGERQIGRAMATLGRITGSDRVCALVGLDPVEVYAWSREERTAPRDGWARCVDGHMSRKTGVEATQLHLDGTRKDVPAQDRAMLGTLGLAAVAAVRKRGSGLVAVGWDAGPARIAPSEMAILAVTLDLLIQGHGQLRLAQDHARLELSLRRARRMETVGAFASGIAHNFNNILAAMLGHAELEELDRRERGEDTQRLAALRAAGRRGQDLVASILAFGRRDGAGPVPFDARAILSETATQLRAAWPPSVALHVDGDDVPVPVLGSGTQVQQVLLNVCRNAAQAVPGTGDVWLSLRAVDVRAPLALSHGTAAPGRYARFGVRDTGTGMDRETLERAFEPFFSGRADGNGLGLATAWDIVKDHTGLWNLSSTPGQGSEFEIWLPLTEQPAPCPAETGRGEAVLVINLDGAALLRDEEVIAALGFEPTGFRDPVEAAKACRKEPGRFDAVVITGIRPPADPAALVRTLRAGAPGVPILLTVGVSSEVDLEALSAAGLSDIVAYGPSAANLRQALMGWVTRRHTGQPIPA